VGSSQDSTLEPLEYFAKRVREHILALIRDALTPMPDKIEQLSTQLHDYDKRIEQMTFADPKVSGVVVDMDRITEL
jgi:hypothetical protein